MQRISMGWFAQWGRMFAPLLTPGGLPHTLESLVVLQEIRPYLELMADERVVQLTLRASRPFIWQLLEQIYGVQSSSDPLAELKKRADQISFLSNRLNIMLEGELSVQPTYNVSPKRAFDSDTLINVGSRVFTDTPEDFDGEEIYNLDQAGKCLAFEIPTAAGFHIFRAAEAVLRRYYQEVIGTLPKLKSRNWGVYIGNLRKHGGVDARILSLLDQIKDLYRNPIMHPETRLDMKQALSLVGVAESVMSAMIADLKIREASRGFSVISPPPASVSSQPNTSKEDISDLVAEEKATDA